MTETLLDLRKHLHGYHRQLRVEREGGRVDRSDYNYADTTLYKRLIRLDMYQARDALDRSDRLGHCCEPGIKQMRDFVTALVPLLPREQRVLQEYGQLVNALMNAEDEARNDRKHC